MADHGEQIECAVRQPNRLSVVLGGSRSSSVLKIPAPFRGNRPFTRLPRGHPRLLCLAWHKRDALRRSHAASGCQAHLSGKNVIPLMAAERARRGKPTTSAASSFGSNA